MCATCKFFQLFRICDSSKFWGFMHSAKFAAVAYSKQLEEFVCGTNVIKYLKFALTIVTHVNS